MSVGSELAPQVPTFTDADGSTVGMGGLVQKYQWYRTAVVKGKTVKTAIPGAVGSHYYIQAADLNATISVLVTTGNAGYIPHVITYGTLPPTLKVLIGTLVGTGVQPVVTMNNPATNELLATPPDVTGQALFPSSLTQHATFTYQWQRNGVNIVGATLQKYKLTSLDTGKDVRVIAKANLAGYTSVVLPPSDGVNYSITLDGVHTPYHSGSAWSVGTQAALYMYTDYATKDGALASPTIAIQWLRSGVAIPGATSDTYQLVAADYNKLISVRLVISKPGYLPLVYLTTNAQLVTLGVDNNAWYPVVQEGPTAGILTAAVADLSPVSPTPTYAYKWYRNGVAIAGATAKTYKLVALDAGKLIKVQVTMARPAFDPTTYTATKQSTEDPHTLYASPALPMITGSAIPPVGETLTATPPDFYDDAAFATVNTGATLIYTWYRTGVAIAGATGPSYTLAAADIGKRITVRVTAVQNGRLAAASPLSAQTAIVVAGTIDLGTFARSPR